MYLFIPDNAHSSKGTHVTAHPSTFASRLNSGERQELAKSTAPTVTPVNNVVKCSANAILGCLGLAKTPPFPTRVNIVAF